MHVTLGLATTGKIMQAGAVAVSLWEKALSLSYLLCDPPSRLKEYSRLTGLRSGCWKAATMINGLSHKRGRPTDTTPEEEKEWLRYAYAILSALKHPNTRSIVYLRSLVLHKWGSVPQQEVEAERDSVAVLILALTYFQVAQALEDFVQAYGDGGQREHLNDELGVCNEAFCEVLDSGRLKVPVPTIKPNKGEFRDVLDRLLKRRQDPSGGVQGGSGDTI